MNRRRLEVTTGAMPCFECGEPHMAVVVALSDGETAVTFQMPAESAEGLAGDILDAVKEARKVAFIGTPPRAQQSDEPSSN